MMYFLSFTNRYVHLANLLVLFTHLIGLSYEAVLQEDVCLDGSKRNVSFQVISLEPKSSNALISGKVLDGCNVTTILSLLNGVEYINISVTTKTFNINVTVQPCSLKNITLRLLTAKNIPSSASITRSFISQPDYSSIAVNLASHNNLSINVTWVNPMCIEVYDMVVATYGNPTIGFSNKTISANADWILVSNLQENTVYQIRVLFKRNNTESNWSETYTITTPLTLVTPGPLITSSLQGTLQLSWNYSSAMNNKTIFNVTVISYRPYDLTYDKKRKDYSTSKTKIDDSIFTIEFATVYNISIVAWNSQSFSKMYTTQLITEANIKNNGPIPQKPQVIDLSETTVTLKIKPVINVDGPLSFYEIIVSTNLSFIPTSSEALSYNEAKAKYISYYAAVRIQPFLLSHDVVIGDKTQNGKFTNPPLASSMKYKIFVRFGSDWNNDLQFSPYDNTEVLTVTTKKESLSATTKAAIAIPSILIVFLAFFLWICYQVRKHKTQDRLESSKDHNSTLPRSKISSAGRVNMGYELDSVKNTAVVLAYAPLKYDVHEKYIEIPISEFPEYLQEIKVNYDIQRQFTQLSNGAGLSCRIGKDPLNGSRNRYEDIVPYDHNRFLLAAEKKESNYINASLISSYTKKDNYIATQGPLPSTFNDFWRMVWQSEARTIVVLGQRIEDGIIKYALYWPTAINVEMKYGKILVKMNSYDKFGSYAVTTLFVYKKSQPKLRTMKLFHFAAWPDRQAPNKLKDILSFRCAVDNWQMEQGGPIIVHCSAGVGRSGTFIAIDAIIENIGRSQTIDIFNYVNYLRTRRLYMVQTQDQYMFIHDALLLHLLCQSTSTLQVNKRNIEHSIKDLSTVDKETNVDGFTKKFQQLSRASIISGVNQSCEGLRGIHAQKNRYSDRVPNDTYRVKLLVTGLTIDETYVNATRVSDRLISTQAPLENTCKDFWLMIYNEGIKNVVMINHRQEKSEIFPDYFSTAETTTHGPLKVTVISEVSSFDSAIKREIIIKHEDKDDEEVIITHYQVTNWPIDGMPDSMGTIVYIVNELMRANSSEPSLFHCNDGFGRSGRLAACTLCVEQLDEFDGVEVDDVVKNLRERNLRYIDAVEQYEFVYRFLKEYLTAQYNGITYI